jgi:hypothetical protein
MSLRLQRLFKSSCPPAIPAGSVVIDVGVSLVTLQLALQFEEGAVVKALFVESASASECESGGVASGIGLCDVTGSFMCRCSGWSGSLL